MHDGQDNSTLSLGDTTPSKPHRAGTVRPGGPKRLSTNILANPMLGSSSNYSLGNISRNAADSPRARRLEGLRKERLQGCNDDLANAVLEEIEGQEGAVVMLPQNHLLHGGRGTNQGGPRPDAFNPHFIHISVVGKPDSWGVAAARRCARTSTRGSSRKRTSSASTRPLQGRRTSCSAAASLFRPWGGADEPERIVHFGGTRSSGCALPAAISDRHVLRTRPGGRGARLRARACLRRAASSTDPGAWDRGTCRRTVLRGFTAFETCPRVGSTPSSGSRSRSSLSPSHLMALAAKGRARVRRVHWGEGSRRDWSRC